MHTLTDKGREEIKDKDKDSNNVKNPSGIHVNQKNLAGNNVIYTIVK